LPKTCANRSYVAGEQGVSKSLTMPECMICYETNDTVAPCGSNTNCSATVCSSCFHNCKGSAIEGYFDNCPFCKTIDRRRGMNDYFNFIVNEMYVYEDYGEGSKLAKLLENTTYLEDEEYVEYITRDILCDMVDEVEEDNGIDEEALELELRELVLKHNIQ